LSEGSNVFRLVHGKDVDGNLSLIFKVVAEAEADGENSWIRAFTCWDPSSSGMGLFESMEHFDHGHRLSLSLPTLDEGEEDGVI